MVELIRPWNEHTLMAQMLYATSTEATRARWLFWARIGWKALPGQSDNGRADMTEKELSGWTTVSIVVPLGVTLLQDHNYVFG